MMPSNSQISSADDIAMLHNRARQHVKAVRRLRELGDFEGNFVYPFVHLATTSLELSLKVIIAVDIKQKLEEKGKNDAKIREKLKEALENKGHDIRELIESVDKIIDIKKKCDIRKIEETSGGMVNDYVIILNDDTRCHFKHSVSSRFASLADEEDVGIFAGANFHEDRSVIELLEKVEEQAEKVREVG